MEDLTSWVAREAQNMGIDFACLSPQTRNNIISILMSGLENGFRSRMDSPDLRFAKRKGIGKQNQILSSQASSSNNLNTNQTSDSSCAMPNNDDQINCPITDLSCPPPGDLNCPIDLSCPDVLNCPIDSPTACPSDEVSCPVDTNCMLMGPCVTDTYYCEENDGWTCDNVCSNRHNLACPDRDNPTTNCIDNKCKDNSCSNNIGHDCSDHSLNGCQDNTCVNNNNCTDNEFCTDTICRNNKECSDFGGSLETTCLDSNCANTPDNRGVGCGDGNEQTGGCKDLSCQNDSKCSDRGNVNIGCVDNVCLNSAPVPHEGCVDTNCTDQPCTNYNCSDKAVPENFCRDFSCVNTGRSIGTIECSTTDGSGCTNAPCTNQGASGYSCTENCGDYQCVHTSTSCDNAGKCIDNSSCLDIGCVNEEICIDQNNACLDDGCKNESGVSSQCIDDLNCSDDECINNNCVNTNNCTDNKCKDTGACTNSPANSCIDENQCTDENICRNLSKNDSTGCTDGMCP